MQQFFDQPLIQLESILWTFKYLNLDVGQVRNKFFDTEFQSHNN